MSNVVNVRISELKKIGYEDFKSWSKNPKNIYIGRQNDFNGIKGSKWNNPFKLATYGRSGCIDEFEKYLRKNKELMSSLPELEGKTLGCWCAPEACHGDVLVKLFNEHKHSLDVEAENKEVRRLKNRIKNCRKKITAISKLEACDLASLKPEQVTKIGQKSELVKEISMLEASLEILE